MNKFFSLSLFLCISFCLHATAQTIHTIIFTDTQDDRIGVAAKASHDYYSLDLLSTIETSIGTSYNSAAPIDRRGYDCNRTTLLQILDNLSCEENDIVVFIYLGHGARGLNDTSNFPQMCFAVPRGSFYRDEDDFYPLENVRDLIMRKNPSPRFCLVIGDCCNSYSPTLSTKPSISEIEAMSPDIIRRQGEEVIKKLFLSKKGSVILTASIKGEYGWCINNGNRKGMLLERNLNDVFHNIREGKEAFSSWEDLLSTVKNNTYRFSQTLNLFEGGRRYTQTPYYEIKLTDAPIIDKRKPKIVAQDLQQALTQVADSRSFTDTERIAMSRALQSKYFDGDNAMVEVVGKDGTTVIQATDIHKYLLRVATESDLANITILEQHKDDNNKVIYLKVHEIYLESLIE